MVPVLLPIVSLQPTAKQVYLIVVSEKKVYMIELTTESMTQTLVWYWERVIDTNVCSLPALIL